MAEPLGIDDALNRLLVARYYSRGMGHRSDPYGRSYQNASSPRDTKDPREAYMAISQDVLPLPTARVPDNFGTRFYGRLADAVAGPEAVRDLADSLTGAGLVLGAPAMARDAAINYFAGDWEAKLEDAGVPWWAVYGVDLATDPAAYLGLMGRGARAMAGLRAVRPPIMTELVDGAGRAIKKMPAASRVSQYRRSPVAGLLEQ